MRKNHLPCLHFATLQIHQVAAAFCSRIFKAPVSMVLLVNSSTREMTALNYISAANALQSPEGMGIICPGSSR